MAGAGLQGPPWRRVLGGAQPPYPSSFPARCRHALRPGPAPALSLHCGPVRPDCPPRAAAVSGNLLGARNGFPLALHVRGSASSDAPFLEPVLDLLKLVSTDTIDSDLLDGEVFRPCQNVGEVFPVEAWVLRFERR
jgi:hypothetical protein